MSSIPCPSKTSSTVPSEVKPDVRGTSAGVMKVNSSSLKAVASPRRLTLNQATRTHIDSTLRKRKTNNGSSAVRPKTFSNAKPQALSGLLGLSTCNSGFLNNLLADVAKAKEDILRAKGRDVSSSSASSALSPPAIKRRRISMPNSANESPVQQTNRPLLSNEPCSFLDLLWEESWLKPPMFGIGVSAAVARLNARPARAVAAAAPPAPTLIPATVSETFTTPPAADEQASVVAKPSSPTTTKPAKMETEDGFGWYVDMDEDEGDPKGISDDTHRYSPYASKGSTDTLAFSAPTAPKASNYDAEVEWAKAADTVDDVLGDIF